MNKLSARVNYGKSHTSGKKFAEKIYYAIYYNTKVYFYKHIIKVLQIFLDNFFIQKKFSDFSVTSCIFHEIPTILELSDFLGF